MVAAAAGIGAAAVIAIGRLGPRGRVARSLRELRVRDRQRHARRERRSRWPTATTTSTWSSSTARRRAPARSTAIAGRGARGPRLPERRHDREVALLVRRAQALPPRAPGRTGRTSGSPTPRRRATGARLVTIAEDAILAKGFDGLFLDNVDMVEVKRHKRSARAWGSWWPSSTSSWAAPGCCSPRTARPGCSSGYPGQGVDPLIDHLDGWNREDVTWTYDFDRRRYVKNRNADREAALDELEEIGDAGLDHDRHRLRGLRRTASATPSARPSRTRSSVGALPYLGNIGLTTEAVEANPPRLLTGTVAAGGAYTECGGQNAPGPDEGDRERRGRGRRRQRPRAPARAGRRRRARATPARATPSPS